MKATTPVRPSTTVSYRERIARAVVAIESDPALNPSLDTLAGHACLSTPIRLLACRSAQAEIREAYGTPSAIYFG